MLFRTLKCHQRSILSHYFWVIFYGFYHGESPFFYTTFGRNILEICSKHRMSKSKFSFVNQGHKPSLNLTAKAPEKMPVILKGKDHLPIINLQVLLLFVSGKVNLGSSMSPRRKKLGKSNIVILCLVSFW